jgi:phosphoribosylformylglycinamidine synthase subunit PurL
LLARAAVIAPVNGAPIGVALGVAGNPRYGKSDPFLAAQYAVVHAVRKVVAVGARPLGLTDCLNFGNPHNVDHYSEFAHAVEGLALAARALDVPYVSGNVSLYNESKNGNAVPASPIVACVGGVENLANIVTAPLKQADSTLLFVGGAHNAAGGAVFAEVLNQTGGPLAEPHYDRIRSEIAFVLAAARAGLILSARTVGDGGMLCALCAMAFATMESAPIGARLSNPSTWTSGSVGDLEWYFGEYTGFVIESAQPDALKAIAKGIDIVTVGRTERGTSLVLDKAHFDLRELRRLWREPLEKVYQ